ncbi:hypothetical protein RMAECT_0649 [Rickettsia rhipicephali str. Ect]|uniref:Uncharacterized protein n=1 Tax=Rickettsia rhipicephali str. Ect TaxID=1359199 RepID=A0A0F3PEG2_RICRH|nr:hypothetical protein RMAECT_0649 [Rickettsia rhipicephali str. Ect]
MRAGIACVDQFSGVIPWSSHGMTPSAFFDPHNNVVISSQ